LPKLDTLSYLSSSYVHSLTHYRHVTETDRQTDSIAVVNTALSTAVRHAL